MEINELLKLMVDKKASDLHIRVGSPPVFRIDGKLVPQSDLSPFTSEALLTTFETITTPEQRNNFYKELELDFAHAVPGVARFRVSVMRQRGTLGFVFRQVPFGVPSIDDLKLPELFKSLVLKPRGLILVTGPTGSGKSTTMAAMINYLNETEAKNIITIEDPIEFLHRNKKSIVAQRDLGDDTKSFATALIHALRQDPNVIVVGEMRDLPTIATALRAAETGHLVLGTLHTTDAPQTIDRIIDVFPPDQQQQIRLQLSQVIEAVISQVLVPKIGGGRAAAFEILLANTAVRNLIREEKIHEIVNVMQLSAKDGMVTLDQSLSELVKKGLVTKESAMLKSSNPVRLERLMGATSFGGAQGAPGAGGFKTPY